MQITKNSPIKSLIEEHPETVDILLDYGLQCVNCYFSEFDTLENGAKIHGLSDQDIEMIVRDLNNILGGKNDTPKTE